MLVFPGNLENIDFPLGEIDIFKVSKITKMQKDMENSSKKTMFFGTSFLEAFWEGFGRVLGDQKPRFSLFFRCFFEVIFEARFEEAKNRPK